MPSAAHVDEGKHGDRRLVGNRRSLNTGFGFTDGRRDRIAVFGDNAEYLNRPRDVLDGLFPARLDFNRDLVAHLVRSTAGYVNAARVRKCLNPGGDIHAVAIDVVAIDDDVTDIDADPELYPTVFRAARIAFANLLLDLDRAGDGVHGARKLHQRAVAHQFERPAGMGRDQGIDEVAPHGLQPGECPGLIDTHQA